MHEHPYLVLFLIFSFTLDNIMTNSLLSFQASLFFFVLTGFPNIELSFFVTLSLLLQSTPCLCIYQEK